MKTIKENHFGMSTILSFALIPISGFATDIYIPSLPSMANELHVSSSAVQLSLILFMISGGISQLFVGVLLDSFGRFKLNLAALLVFAFASFVIALSGNIYTIYLMRILQGVTVALIVVAKRAYFVDIYSGEKLKHYISLFSIVWATAPIIAPFLGGYLQAAFGWQSNFYFLGGATVLIAGLEVLYSGESLKVFHPFKAKSILEVYSSKIKTLDFTVGLFILGLSYLIVVVHGMASPFIIERVFHYSPVITGYCALLSGIALMTGGIISKMFINRPLLKKIGISIPLQLLLIIGMITTSIYRTNIFTLMAFTLLIHLMSGFTFNNVLTFCLGRFTKNAGMTAGIAGGSLYIISSVLSYGIIKQVTINSQLLLGGAYLGISILLIVALVLFRKFRNVSELATRSLDVNPILSRAA